MDARTLYSFGVALILTGILVNLVAFLLLFVSSVRRKGKVRGGGAIIIGPFPIIFGTDKESAKKVLLLSLALTILLLMVMVIFHLTLR